MYVQRHAPIFIPPPLRQCGRCGPSCRFAQLARLRRHDPGNQQDHGSRERRQVRDSPVSRSRARSTTRRHAPPHQGDPLARKGDGRRRIAGRAARDDSELAQLLGDRARLAQVRGEAELLPAVHHRDRRAGHSFHSRALEARECDAADRHARLARLGHRAAQDHRSAHQSDGARRDRIGCIPSGDSVDARLRLFGKPTTTGWGPERIARRGSR